MFWVCQANFFLKTFFFTCLMLDYIVKFYIFFDTIGHIVVKHCTVLIKNKKNNS